MVFSENFKHKKGSKKGGRYIISELRVSPTNPMDQKNTEKEQLLSKISDLEDEILYENDISRKKIFRQYLKRLKENLCNLKLGK
jgi:hypothetical protein